MKCLLYIACAVLYCVSLTVAGTNPQIGMAISAGPFVLDHNRVSGTATVFDGDVVETSGAPSSLRLDRGVRVDLESNSRGSVYHDKLVLEEGRTVAELGPSYVVEAKGLVLKSTSNETRADVLLLSRGVHVAVDRGSLDVTTGQGTLLARMGTGASIDYSPPDAGVPTTDSRVQLTGKLEESGGHYLLRDATTSVTYELTGPVPKEAVGRMVTVAGTVLEQQPYTGAEKVVRVESAKRLAGGGPCAFWPGANGSERVRVAGPLKSDQGHYLLRDSVTGATYELTGNVDSSNVGKNIKVQGTYVADKQPFPPAEQVLYIGGGKPSLFDSACAGAIIGGVAMVAAGLIPLTGGHVVPTPISH